MMCDLKICFHTVGVIFLITLSIVYVSAQIPTWLQEHQEMISSSKSWMAEAKSWLATPCTYTTAKCLSSHVHTLQVGALIWGLNYQHCRFFT